MANSVHTDAANGNYVSPIATYVSPDATISIDYQQGTVVTITGIVNQFDYKLTLEESAALLNAFQVNDFVIDCRLQGHAPDFSQVTVGMVADAGVQAAMKDAIAHALVEAKDPGNVGMDQFLANILRDAFSSVFPNLLGSNPVSNVNGTPLNADGSTGASRDLAEAADTQVQNNASLPGTNAGAAAIVNSVSVQTSSRINGFAVDVFTNTTTSAAALWDAHNGQDLKQLFLQIPRDTYELYLPADVSGEFEVLHTNALPMKLGDKITFVFDIDVNTAGKNTTARGTGATGSSESLTGAIGGEGGAATISYPDNNVNTAVGEGEFSLNLSNQRVAFNLTLWESGGQDAGATGYKAEAAAFAIKPSEGEVSGADLTKGMLRLTSESAAAGANPGPGVGPAGSWPNTDGSTGAVDDGATGAGGYTGDVQGNFGNQQPR